MHILFPCAKSRQGLPGTHDSPRVVIYPAESGKTFSGGVRPWLGSPLWELRCGTDSGSNSCSEKGNRTETKASQKACPPPPRATASGLPEASPKVSQRSLLEGTRPRFKPSGWGSREMLTMLPGPLRCQRAGGRPHASCACVCARRRPLRVPPALSDTWPPLPGVCGPSTPGRNEGVELSVTHVLQDALPSLDGLEGRVTPCVASGFSFLAQKRRLSLLANDISLKCLNSQRPGAQRDLQ